MAWNSKGTIDLTGKVDGVEVEFIFYPDLGYFECEIPRQFDETYVIELYCRNAAGTLNYLSSIEILKGRVTNIGQLHHAIYLASLLNKRKF